jgi:phosphoribosylanthranilate isomerase
VIIKICGITNEADAWMAIEAGATALGFNFWPKSPRFVEPQDWMRQLPVLKVGVFVGAVTNTETIDVAQIYGDKSPDGLRVWRAVKPYAPRNGAEAYVMDVSEGTGKTFDWKLAQGLHEKIILAGGLDASNVMDAIREGRPWGVDSCSRLESSPGRKDAVKVREFVAAAKEGFRFL